MKNRLRQHFLVGLLLITALFSLISTSVFAAGNDSAWLAPASGTTQVGSTLTIDIDGHLGGYWWGGGPNIANATLTFPANLLQVTSIDKSNVTFPNTDASYDNAAGTITYHGTTNPFTYTNAYSDAHLLRINFRTIASGSASVAFSSMSYSTGSGGTTGGTYTIVSPPPVVTPSPTPKPSSSPKPSVKPKPSTSVAPTPTPTPSMTPVVEQTTAPTTSSDGGLSVNNVIVSTTRQKTTVTWTLNNPDATQTFMYGTTKSNQKTEATPTKREDGSYSAELPGLKPGTLYYFSIKASTADKLQGAAYSGTLITRGYPVQLTVQQNGVLASGAKVIIGERTFTANKDAIITAELPDGTQSASITTAGSQETYKVTFAVEKKTIPATGNPELQSFVLNAVTENSSAGSGVNILAVMLGGIGAMALIGGGIFGFLTYRRRQQNQTPGALAVDSDLLSSSYGTALEDTRTLTPEPNLEAHTALMNDPATPPDVGVMQPPTIEPAPLTVPDPVIESPQGIAQQSDGQPYEPSEMAPAVADAVIAEPPIDEELSAPVTLVESIEEVHDTLPADTSEQAIYHPETGELDIIHGHNSASAPADVQVADSQPAARPATTQSGGAS